MRKIKILIICCLVFVIKTPVIGQAPESFNYQAVVRNNSGELIANQFVGIQIGIIQGSSLGSSVYSETHTVTSNTYGLVNLKIGTGLSSDNFSTIDWSSGPYFIQVKLDISGGTNYQLVGTSQVLSVPFALHSKTAETVSNLNILGTENVFNGWDKDTTDDFNGQYSSLSGAPSNVSHFSNDAGYITGFSEVDGDTINELQSLSQVLNINNDGGYTQIKYISDPTEEQDVATKSYVDELKLLLLAIQAEKGVTDVNGNVYKTVAIGDQIWMAENLRTVRYPNGTPIPNVDDRTQNASGSNNSAWAALESGNHFDDAAYCWYNNDSIQYASKKGALYTWAAAMGATNNISDTAVSSNTVPSNIQGICPDGWHLPSNKEWEQLLDYLASEGFDGTQATALKATFGWGSEFHGTDNYNFSAIPGGMRYSNNGEYYGADYHAKYWTCTQSFSSAASIQSLTDDAYVERYTQDKSLGYSVRCVKDPYTIIKYDIPLEAPYSPIPSDESTEQKSNVILQWKCNNSDVDTFTYNVYLDTLNGSNISASGIKEMFYSPSGLQEGLTYYWKVEVNNGEKLVTSSTWNFTIETGSFADGTAVTDYDGNVYSTVKIGSQVWMAENLRTTHYADGTAIPNIDDRTQNGSGANPSAWIALDNNNTDKAYCWYNNDSITYSQTYGALYSFAAAVNGVPSNGIQHVQGACPDGWHVPSNVEWSKLESFISNDFSSDSLGLALKSLNGWNDYMGESGNGIEYYGFSALPAGARSKYDGLFYSENKSTNFWSSTQRYIEGAFGLSLNYYAKYITKVNNFKSGGYSIRCIRDE